MSLRDSIPYCVEYTAKAIETSGERLATAMLYAPFNISLCRKAEEEEENAPPSVVFIPGHFFSALEHGPGRPARLAVIGKYPQHQEAQQCRLFVGAFGQDLRRLAGEVDLPLEEAYATNIVRFYPGRLRWRSWWVEACSWFLLRELEYTRPEYLLLLGSEACRLLLGRAVSSVRGAVLEHEIAGSTYRVMATTLEVARTATAIPGFRQDLAVLADHMAGKKISPLPAEYQLIQDEEQLEEAVEKLLAYEKFSIDTEWGGGRFPEGRLRSIQIGYGWGKAIFLDLRDCDLAPVFKPSIEACVPPLKKLLEREEVEVSGQNLRGDLCWLERLGLWLRPRFKFDTMLADHVLEAARPHSLTDLALRYTGMGRYDAELMAFLDENKIDVKKEGYQRVPLSILFPYGCADADAAYRCREILEEKLEEKPRLKQIYADCYMGIQPVLAEMEDTGWPIDRARVMMLSDLYEAATDQLRSKVQDTADGLGMTGFNPRSSKQIGKLLFEILGLQPVKTTKGQDWQRAVGNGETAPSPSVDHSVLATLRKEHPVVQELLDYRGLYYGTVNRFFKPYSYTDGQLVPAPGSLLSFIREDGRIHTTFGQLTTTGRLTSRDPNLQNLPLKTEQRFRTILGRDDIPSIRSCFYAPEGQVIVAGDYKQAELFVLATLSGDRHMLAILNDPERDFHAERAISMYGLPWPGPGSVNPRTWIEEQGLSHLRGHAKTFHFSVSYQISDLGLWLDMIKVGVDCSRADCRRWITEFFEEFSTARDYLEENKRLGVEQGYVENPFGLVRRFYLTDNEEQMAAAAREAANFPIQSTVAMIIKYAMLRLYELRERLGISFTFVHQQHDAAQFFVAEDEAEGFAKLLPELMLVEIPGYGVCPEVEVSIKERW